MSVRRPPRWAVGLAAGLLACRGGSKARRAADDAAIAIDAAPPVVLDAAALQRVQTSAAAGAAVTVLASSPQELALAIATADVRVTLTVAACLQCVAMEPAAWQAHRAELVALWAPGVDAVPPVDGASLTIAALSLPAGAAIAIDARRGADAGATYVGQWNDGHAQVVATCEVPALAAGAANPCTPAVDAALGRAVAALRDVR